MATPGLGTASIAGKTPAIELIINNAESSMAIEGYAPIPSGGIPSQDINASPSVGSGTLTGLAPSRAHGLLLMGYAPSLDKIFIGIPIPDPDPEDDTEQPSIIGQAPLALVGAVAPEAGSVSVTTYAPDITGQDIFIDSSLSITGKQPSIGGSYTISPDTGEMAITGRLPGIPNRILDTSWIRGFRVTVTTEGVFERVRFNG